MLLLKASYMSGAEAQAALRQASVDNHAVVLEPVRLPEDHATYSSQIWIWEDQDVRLAC